MFFFALSSPLPVGVKRRSRHRGPMNFMSMRSEAYFIGAVKMKLVLLEHQTITISSQSSQHILILPVYPFSIQSVYT